ncbi:hypothetical protein C4K68_18325 [Pokkaliibacter plantistimulans]|uniref:RDD domain-containing protein n=1 Tax=Proteobacteria bacterium 228 TaxID=2083153 RepID=A0A2S5KMT7_9PROT|nr:RDD family protein [Pokkaliibacter plantistimulans]PPC75849.1 hypothetical protein C4K68_18325 [Pokkaliibacter plantistimulans]
MPRPFDEGSALAQSYPAASLLRRLAAMFYDSLLCIALLMVLTAIAMAVSNIGNTGPVVAVKGPLFRSLLFISVFAFFAKFWTWPGQTLGMQCWRVRVQRTDGQPISYMQALVRFLMACLSLACCGLGFLWSLWDKERLTWHDRYSESRLVVLPKTTRKQ